MRIADKTGKLSLEEVDAEGHCRPEVDRNKLRGMLLDSLPEFAIPWGSKMQNMHAIADGRHEDCIETADGAQKSSFDIVIGADGAWSKVRSLLSSTKPHYSTIPAFDCRIRSLGTKYPHISSLIGQGSYFAPSQCKCIIAQRNGDGSKHIYIMFQEPET